MRGNYYPQVYLDLKQIGVPLEAEVEFFEGAIRGGKKEGFCKVLYRNGVSVEGFFQENQIRSGTIMMSNGLEFSGEFQ